MFKLSLNCERRYSGAQYWFQSAKCVYQTLDCTFWKETDWFCSGLHSLLIIVLQRIELIAPFCNLNVLCCCQRSPLCADWPGFILQRALVGSVSIPRRLHGVIAIVGLGVWLDRRHLVQQIHRLHHQPPCSWKSMNASPAWRYYALIYLS